ncbi:MAG: TIGR00730 family Rossman fold protein [Bacteroidales bacterium]|nr:TIGR00730 family Rossman fold protein [Bacteroidales bacterium]
MSTHKVCIFCASSQKVPEVYFQAAADLAKILVGEGITIVYGGGSVGLMGQIADTALENNGKIIGIIPQFMFEKEWGNSEITELIIVKDMHERKRKMIEDVDAVLALPGGCGTLEELAEVITLKQLGQFVKPIILLNTKGFYDSLINLYENMIRENFMRDKHREIWQVVNDPSEIIHAIENAPEWHPSIISIAQI